MKSQGCVRIIGIDPGYAIVGYGIVDYRGANFSPVAYGSITTPAGMPFEKRLQHIYRELNRIIEKYGPTVMSVEKLFFQNNQKTAIDVAQARGLVLLAGVENGMSIHEYTPLQVKQAVVGYGKAEKHQVQMMTKALLNLKEIPKPDDTADALAIAICHGNSAGIHMYAEGSAANRLQTLLKAR